MNFLDEIVKIYDLRKVFDEVKCTSIRYLWVVKKMVCVVYILQR